MGDMSNFDGIIAWSGPPMCWSEARFCSVQTGWRMNSRKDELCWLSEKTQRLLGHAESDRVHSYRDDRWILQNRRALLWAKNDPLRSMTSISFSSVLLITNLRTCSITDVHHHAEGGEIQRAEVMLCWTSLGRWDCGEGICIENPADLICSSFPGGSAEQTLLKEK